MIAPNSRCSGRLWNRAPEACEGYSGCKGRTEVTVRIALITVGVLLLVGAAAGAEEPLATPTPAPTAAPQRLKLNLNDWLEPKEERGHAEFDLGLRREIWRDPMVRLAFAVSREEASLMRGGPVPLTATSLLMPRPGADPRLVLSGPFASDWHELTNQEKIGRIAESAVCWGLILGLARALR
jgi:hypothetical protein